MLQQTVFIFWIHLCQWNEENYSEEEIIPHVNTFASVRYLLALYYLEKILPEAKRGVPLEKILAVLKPTYDFLTPSKVRSSLKSSPLVRKKRGGYVLNREKIQAVMRYCPNCGNQLVFDKPGCQNPVCPLK